MKKVILVRKHCSNGIHLTHSLLIGSLFILLILFVSVAYAAYYYGGQQVKQATLSTAKYTVTTPHSTLTSCEISPPFFINNSAFSWTEEENIDWLNLCADKVDKNAHYIPGNPAALEQRLLHLQKHIIKDNQPPFVQSTDLTEKAFLEKDMMTLIDQLAHLQTELLHLDELGKQLVDMVELDAKEFDFNLTWEGIVTEQQIIAVEDAEFMGETFPVKQGEQALTDEQTARIAEIERSITEVAKYIKDRREKFEVLESLLLRRRSGAKILPVGWPLKQGYISSRYGWRGNRMHKGLDLAAPTNSEVLTVEKGVVTISGSMRGYGNIVEVKHSDTYTTRYAHNRKNLVKVGDEVEKGQVIALLGATGRATGAHVHFEVRRAEEPLNPMEFLSSVETFLLTETIKVSAK
jgi:murein DD-endopeptidase MepM/ murein hydrolase activator NlpD